MRIHNLELKQPLLCALYWVVAMTFTKQIDFGCRLSTTQAIKAMGGMPLLIIYDILLIGGMLFFNGISMRCAMLNFKNNGSFMGQSLLMAFTFICSSLADFILNGGQLPRLERVFGGLLILAGIGFVASANAKHKLEIADTELEKCSEKLDTIENSALVVDPVETVLSPFDKKCNVEPDTVISDFKGPQTQEKSDIELTSSHSNKARDEDFTPTVLRSLSHQN